MSLPYFSQREPEEPEDASEGRGVFNDKPPADELLAVSGLGKTGTTSLPDNIALIDATNSESSLDSETGARMVALLTMKRSDQNQHK